MTTAQTPFRFYTALVLEEATGLRAATLPQLVRLLREVPEECIHHHTHDFLLAHHFLTPEPTNDFAYWATEVLGEGSLGERLASIDTMEYGSLQELRAALIQTIDAYLKQSPLSQFKFVSEGKEFFFSKSIHVIIPTGATASTLEEFAEALEQSSIYSLYYHIFSSRLRLKHPTNDFAVWLEQQLGETDLAHELAVLDPYAETLDALRDRLVALVRTRAEAASRDAPSQRL